MDFMFEDDVDEVGSDVEAYCPKCKADTTHVVISKYEDEIRRVQCNPCGDVHSFRKPRGETEDDVPEPVAAKKRALLKKPGWEDFFAKRHSHDPKPYEFREHYRENAIVNHPKFGVGFVSEIVSDSKVEITFKDARRILVHNRRDIPGLPLAAEGDGVPTPVKGAKAPKGKEARDAKESREAREAKGKGANAEKAVEAKPTAPPNLKVVPKAPAAPAAKEDAKPAGKLEKAPAKAEKPAAKPEKVAVKAEAKGKAAAKPAPKPAKAAPARGVKTAAKPAAKKPAPKPKKKAGKKR